MIGTGPAGMVAPATTTSSVRDGRLSVRLTPRQIKVLRGVHSGQCNKQIAYDLGIAEATVKGHMTALMRKLNVNNRTQVAIVAQSLMLHRAWSPPRRP